MVDAALVTSALTLLLLSLTTSNVAEASFRNWRYRQSIRKIFKKEEFRNGGVIDFKGIKGFFCPELSVISSFQNGPSFGEIEVVGCSHMEELAGGGSMPTYTNVLRGIEINSKLLKKIAQGKGLFVLGATGGGGKLDMSKASDLFYSYTKFNFQGRRQSDETKRKAARSVLIFHITSDGVANTDSVDEMSDIMFGTFGEQAATGTGITNGVVKVIVNPGDTNWDSISNAAKVAATNMRIDLRQYDHLMFALPPSATDGGIPLEDGDNSWAGLGQLQDRESWYCNTMIVDKMVAWHEFGHNLGFQHSGEEVTYDDWTCIMGNNIGDNGRACLNGAKMSESGWYSDREVIFDPQSGTSTSFKLINTNDYGASTSEYAMPLQIVYQNKNGNLFAYYNKLEGITINSNEYRGEVIIDQRVLGTEYKGYAESKLLYHIPVGSSQTITSFNGNDDLTISFESIGTDGNVNYALVNVQLGDVQPVAPISPTTTAPISSPISPPTSAPISPPVSSPTVVQPMINSLGTAIGGENKVIGYMFNLQAVSDISILNFAITALKEDTKVKYKIYTIDGSDFPSSDGGWGAVYHQKSKKGKGKDQTVSLGNFVCPVDIKEGAYKSFYILAKGKKMLSTKVDIKPSTPFTSDNYVKFMKQKAQLNSDGKTNKKYVWNGIITYQNFLANC